MRAVCVSECVCECVCVCVYVCLCVCVCVCVCVYMCVWCVCVYVRLIVNAPHDSNKVSVQIYICMYTQFTR